MENNIAEQPVAETVVMTPSHNELEKSKSRFWMLFLALFVLGLFFLGGTYFFVSSQKAAYIPSQITNQPLDTQKDINQMESETAALDMKDVDDDFTEVDQELKNL